MSNKRFRLPKEGLVGPAGSGENPDFVDTTRDVEGHAWVNPAPPIDFVKRSPTQGGELLPTDPEADDVEGHRWS